MSALTDGVNRIRTSCGKTFEISARDMTDRQLRELIEQNKDRTDINPADLATLYDEGRRRLLKHYADKTPKVFHQFDGWLTDAVGHDGHGGTTIGFTWELMSAGDVRVLIPVDTTSADAVKLLREIIGCIERAESIPASKCPICGAPDVGAPSNCHVMPPPRDDE
jgi:hypothetical protein